MGISWKQLEENVKLIASYKWNCNAIKETIAGINFDCVLKPRPDYWIIVETTEEFSLEKVRLDISKYSACKLFLISSGIFS
jgi:hypothetical protein